MNYTIIHELPHRLRIHIDVPRVLELDYSQIEAFLSNISGLKKASYNERTKRVLIVYNGSKVVKDNFLKAIKEMPFAPLKKKEQKPGSLEKNKRAILIASSLLLAKPFLPPHLRPLFAIYGALHIFKKGLRALFRRSLNADVLDSAAIGVAIGMRDYTSAGVITLLLRIGEYLAEWTKQRVRKRLSEMFYPSDGQVWVKRGGKPIRLNVREIEVGDLVVLRAGGIIPVDGIVVEGEAMVNQASMTGEPFPVLKTKGAMVYAGTAIEEGTLSVQSVKVGEETRMSRIIKVIEESEGLKAEVQSHAEKLADRVVSYTFLLSGLTYVLTGNPARAASVLLVDYSCAIKLSTPLAIMSAMLQASQQGIIIKGGKFIEKMANVDVFVLDKTGTLTEAKPEVVDVVPFNGYAKHYILRNVACVEEHFPHPFAKAIVRSGEVEGLIHAEEQHSEVEYVLAHGISSSINGKRMLVGSRQFIHDHSISVECAATVIKGFAERGYSILYVAIGEMLAGIIAIHDRLKDDSHRFSHSLRRLGMKRLIMLTGDNEASARNVAQKLGIEEFYAQALPDRKAMIIKDLKNKGHVVAMVGDGINDSPALAHADIGISMKDSSDIAQEACDVLLLNGKLTDILIARQISQDAMSTIKQNYRYIVGINTFLIVSGLSGALSPLLSALLHNSTTVMVAANSLRPHRIASIN